MPGRRGRRALRPLNGRPANTGPAAEPLKRATGAAAAPLARRSNAPPKRAPAGESAASKQAPPPVCPPPPPVWGPGPPPPPPPSVSPAAAPLAASRPLRAVAATWAPHQLVQATEARLASAPPPRPVTASQRSLGHASVTAPFVDVERRSNCALDAIIAVLLRCSSFRRALSDGPAEDSSRPARSLREALCARILGQAAVYDAEVDELRKALAASGVATGQGLFQELTTCGAHLAVVDVFDALIERCPARAKGMFEASGSLDQKACRFCGNRNEDSQSYRIGELVQRVLDFALVEAATGMGVDESLMSLIRKWRAPEAAKSCDACGKAAACDVRPTWTRRPRLLALSIATSGSVEWTRPVIRTVLDFVARRDARVQVRDAFGIPARGQRGGRRTHYRKLFAVVVFRNEHFTAFVRASDGADAWTYKDGRRTEGVGPFAGVILRCAEESLVPSMLFYD